MIPDQWYAILESSEVAKGRPIGVTRMSEKLVLWREVSGELVCLRDRCAHRGASLSKGKIERGEIECPFHGLKYDRTGGCTVIPANGRDAPVPERFKVNDYKVLEKYGFIWIWWGEPREDYPQLPFFEDIDESFSYLTLRDHWSTHYSRAIENQLDVAHLPFVHANTIGRGGRTLVNGPRVKLDGNKISVWFDNEVDRGQRPLRPNEMPEPQRPALLHFLFPNIWQNRLSEDSRIVVAFSPVDDENTVLYVRMYQRVVRVPILRELFNLISLIGNRVIVRQDRRVVVTQLPKRTELKMGERLFQADRPIVMYRRRREELTEGVN